MKHEITSTKIQTNSKLENLNNSVATSDFEFEISNFKRLKGVQ